MTLEEALDKLDGLSDLREVEELLEEIYDDYLIEVESGGTGHIVGYSQFGRLKPNTRYRIYVEEVHE